MRYSLPIIALAAIAAPVSAVEPVGQETVTVRVAFADLDITSDEGRAVLEQRVEAEVRQACTVETRSRYRLGRDIVDEQCLADARAEALAQVERVAAMQARSGRAVAAN